MGSLDRLVGEHGVVVEIGNTEREASWRRAVGLADAVVSLCLGGLGASFIMARAPLSHLNHNPPLPSTCLVNRTATPGNLTSNPTSRRYVLHPRSHMAS